MTKIKQGVNDVPKYGKKYTDYKCANYQTVNEFYDKSFYLDVLFDIKNANPSWGSEWYSKVQDGFYESAKVLLAISGKGNARNDALDILDKIIELK